MTVADDGERLAVLMYHGIVREPLSVPDWCFLDEYEFRTQMEFLAEHFRVVPLSEAPHALAAVNGEPVVALTFDDGFQSFAKFAYPILERLSLPATVFLPTDFVDTERRIWFCEVHRAIAMTSQASITWEGNRYDLSTIAAREIASAEIQAGLKKHPQDRLFRELEDITSQLRDEDARSGPDDDAYRLLQSAEVKAFAARGLVTFGAHTGSHAILSLLRPSERLEEIRRSILDVGEWTGRPCDTFAYPNGRASDYTADCVEILRDLGVRIGVSTEHGGNGSRQSLLELKRYGVGADTRLSDLETWLQPFRLLTPSRPQLNRPIDL